jgi:hypothetical protein
MRVREGNGTEWEISIEAKNCTSKQNTKLRKFYERVYERNTTSKKEIYIYVSLHPMADEKPCCGIPKEEEQTVPSDQWS